MTKHGISFTLGSLFTLFVAIIFLNLGLFASGTDLIEDGQHTALNFVNIAHAQSDEQMVSETYLSPAKQLKDGVGMHDIQCNDSRELYIRQSQIPVCLYAETYDLMQSRGIELVPATPSSSTSTGIFTSEEAQWLADNPVIRVSFDPGWTPIEYADESGNLQGITLDYIAEFEAISGADLVPVPAAGTWADALMAVEERNAEIMYMVASTPERLEYMSFTSPHYTIKTSMISLNDTPLNIDDEGLRLITIRSYAIEAWLDENHPDIEYISVDSPADAYALLAAGGADAFTSVWPAATHHAKMSGVDNVYNVGTTGHQYDLTVGYRNDLPLLGSIMQKVLDQIPQEKIDSWYDVTLTLADVDLTPESIVMGVVDDIIALYDSDPENAFEQITSMMATDPSYPFVLDYDTGVIVAHGSNPELVNVLSTSIADLDRPYDVIRSDLLEGHTWVKYTFENPATGTEQIKLSLFVLHDGYIFGSGYYTEHDVTLTLADVDLTPESIVMGVVDDIIALYDSDPENAFEQITSMMATDPSYPFVLDYDTGVIVAHGSNPELVNVLSTSIADLDRPYDVIRSDLLEGHTWVKYTFENPATGTEQIKLSLFVLHDGYIFGSGYYTEHDVTLTLADVDLTPESIVMGVVDDIIALYDSDPENAFEQITSMMATDPSYPFVLDYDTGVIVAHGSNPELVNVLSTSIADLDRPYDVIRSDLLEGHTWVKYTFENPATGTEQIKLSLFVLHDGYIFGSGYYTELTPADIFSPEEVEWLENNPVIRVSFDPEWTPIEYADESGNLQGVTLDYIAEFEAISGADLVPVPAAGTWADALMAVEERNAEIMYMVASTPERLEYMSFTSPHYTIKTFMISLNDTPLNIDDEGLTLVTINGYAIEAWLDENHPDTEYIPVDSPADAYALLAAGGADAFTSAWPAATHHAKMSGVDNVYNVGTTGHQYDLTVGYRNDLPLLGSIMQKTLDNIPQERIDSWYDAVAQTTDDAETLESVVIGVIDDAIALYDSDPANAFEQITSMELTNPQYPFAMDYLTTQIVAHGAFPERVGEIAVALTESNIPLDVILSDLKKGNVWAEYVFANPSTGIEQTKRSLYVLHEGYIFSSGYYITS